MKDYIQISDSLTSATDEMKYYLNCTKDNEDNKEVNPAYLEKLEDLYHLTSRHYKIVLGISARIQKQVN